MHPRNKHQSRYDFPSLIKSSPTLKAHVFVNKFGDESIDFANPDSVKSLNQALLKNYYGLSYWDIPQNYLCPPIPGRADYIHYLADLLGTPKSALILDVGVGANCVYPLIGNKEYGWRFIGSDVDRNALNSAQKIIDENDLNAQIELRLQSGDSIFQGIIKAGEKLTATMCNPPFHASAEEAAEGSNRKMKNLGIKSGKLNFGGMSHELWVPGGEISFIKKMFRESADFAHQCQWFTTLISKKDNIPVLRQSLKQLPVTDVRMIEMTQGQKISRILAWSFSK